MISLWSLKGLIGCPRCRRSVGDGKVEQERLTALHHVRTAGDWTLCVSIAVDGAGGKRGGNYRFRLVGLLIVRAVTWGVALRRLLEPP